MKKRIIKCGVFGCLLLLAACQPVPNKPTNSEIVSSPSSSVSISESPTSNADISVESDALLDTNMSLIRSVDGEMVEETLVTAEGKQIILDAQVSTENVEGLRQYQYIPLQIPDKVRKALFAAYFEDRSSEMTYDERNDVWKLRNSEAVGDYYLYQETIPMAGESVPGEEIFTLAYRAVDLYPFEDNLLSTSSECNVSLSLEDVFSLCDRIIDAVAPQDEYTADTILPYGNQGRRPYYKIFYRRTVDGMPIVGYNDLYFMVDSTGIQTISGSFYDLNAQPLSSQILSLEEALEILRENVALINFYGEDSLSVGAISLEYIVTLTEMKEAIVVPAWRFNLGADNDSLEINRRRVLAIDAITGNLIQGERGMNF